MSIFLNFCFFYPFIFFFCLRFFSIYIFLTFCFFYPFIFFVFFPIYIDSLELRNVLNRFDLCLSFITLGRTVCLECFSSSSSSISVYLCVCTFLFLLSLCPLHTCLYEKITKRFLFVSQPFSTLDSQRKKQIWIFRVTESVFLANQSRSTFVFFLSRSNLVTKNPLTERFRYSPVCTYLRLS
jgi:hypothetical protein